MSVDKIINGAIKRVRNCLYEDFINRVQNNECSIQDYYDIIDSIIEPIVNKELVPFEYLGKEYLINPDNIVYNKELLIPVGYYDKHTSILSYNEI